MVNGLMRFDSIFFFKFMHHVSRIMYQKIHWAWAVSFIFIFIFSRLKFSWKEGDTTRLVFRFVKK